MDTISLEPFTKKHLPHYYRWTEVDFVKNTWFQEGHEPVNAILKKIKGNGHDYPFVILLNKKPIGFIQYCNLHAYHTTVEKPTGVFSNEPKGSYCIDLFIGEKDYLNKGLGTKAMEEMIALLFSKPEVKRLVIDPATTNKRAIYCYKKVGFKIIKETCEQVNAVTVLELNRSDWRSIGNNLFYRGSCKI